VEQKHKTDLMPPPAVQEFTIEVVAPSNLEGGSEFLAKPYKVRIPDGGVTQGQRFDAVILTLQAVAGKSMNGGHEYVVNVTPHGGKNATWKIRVPDGGVRENQRFEAVIVSEQNGCSLDCIFGSLLGGK
jgi:adenine C2-methylase RlmN of 23S rRNA A2503 and tRNA A37